DSPGGSAFAAEVIADEIDALRAAGKPVVASMSSVAASGGYTIAMNADRIFASPATVTGSIGVFGMFPTYQRTMAAVGVATDGIGTTPWSGELRPDREMADATKQLVQLLIEDTYDDFISAVAERRGLEKTAVDQIGQGQVWTGTDALANGLVDELGSFENAIAAAASFAGLTEEEYGIKKIEPELSATEQLIVDLLGVVKRSGLDISSWLDEPTALQGIALGISEKAEIYLGFNDPKGVYAHCLCDFE
ncbi:MAG: S49 family peptidase, partial [Gammaproteobacteria bacterium]|nr:S49 family peptidase [Gammaproteobacteria bacterium]